MQCDPVRVLVPGGAGYKQRGLTPTGEAHVRVVAARVRGPGALIPQSHIRAQRLGASPSSAAFDGRTIGQREFAPSEGQGTYLKSTPAKIPTAPAKHVRANSVPAAIEVQYMIG